MDIQHSVSIQSPVSTQHAALATLCRPRLSNSTMMIDMQMKYANRFSDKVSASREQIPVTDSVVARGKHATYVGIVSHYF